MIISSDLGGAGGVPARRDGHRLVASIDVEWTKNYRIANGNVPFCWSVIWLEVYEDQPAPVPPGFGFTSTYVNDSGQTQDLITAADAQLRNVLLHADLIVGHQLTSDLAVLRRASLRPLASVEELRTRWHDRRHTSGTSAIMDTRYDMGSILRGGSRRLVDVCTELGLDVTQPELASTSMTALHRRWLTAGDESARERISVLNLRHSLSAAYVALRNRGLASWTRPLNVNQVLDHQLSGMFGWLTSSAFRRLL